MNLFPFNFKSSTRALTLAAVLGGATLASAPAQAAETVQFGFSINSGDGMSFSFGNGGFNGRQFGGQREPHRQVCFADVQLRKVLRSYGFRNIDLERSRDIWVHATAERNGRDFEMDINRCTAQVANLQRVEPWGWAGGWGGIQQGWDSDGFYRRPWRD